LAFATELAVAQQELNLRRVRLASLWCQLIRLFVGSPNYWGSLGGFYRIGLRVKAPAYLGSKPGRRAPATLTEFSLTVG